MPMYTFHLFSETGAAIMLDAVELPDDAATFTRSGDLLDEHLSCDRVDVWEGERAVVARHRHQPIIRPLEPAPDLVGLTQRARPNILVSTLEP